MNIYEMFLYESSNFGFFVNRNSWRENLLFQVCRFSKNLKGKKPYFNNPDVIGRLFEYTYHKNNFIISQIPFKFGSLNNSSYGFLSCPGNYSYSLIHLPHLYFNFNIIMDFL